MPGKGRKHQYLSALIYRNGCWLDKTRYFQICLAVIIFSFNFGKCFATDTELQYRDHEIAAYVKAGYAQASILQQSYVQLIAPDVQFQLQQLANEIAVANGVDMKFRVHITNDSYIGTFSMGSGDIFIPLGYLDMVANRDEIAFGLAREIVIQHRLLHLQDMEEAYTENKRNQQLSLYSSIVISSAINSAFNYFVIFPINKRIMEELLGTPRIYPGMSEELTRYVIFEKNLQYRQMSGNVSSILWNLLGWVPTRISNETLKLVSQTIKISNEDANASRRKYKNEWGLTYLGIAGFDPAAGNAVIKKIEEWWSTIESNN